MGLVGVCGRVLTPANSAVSDYSSLSVTTLHVRAVVLRFDLETTWVGPCCARMIGHRVVAHACLCVQQHIVVFTWCHYSTVLPSVGVFLAGPILAGAGAVREYVQPVVVHNLKPAAVAVNAAAVLAESNDSGPSESFPGASTPAAASASSSSTTAPLAGGRVPPPAPSCSSSLRSAGRGTETNASALEVVAVTSSTSPSKHGLKRKERSPTDAAATAKRAAR